MGIAGNEIVSDVLGRGKDLAKPLVSYDMLYRGMHIPNPFTS